MRSPLCLALSLCVALSPPLNAQIFADSVLIHGKIWTENPQQPEAEALAIFADRIVRVGSSADILKLVGPATKVIELAGKRVVPGFNDAHVHLTEGGAAWRASSSAIPPAKPNSEVASPPSPTPSPKAPGYKMAIGTTNAGTRPSFPLTS